MGNVVMYMGRPGEGEQEIEVEQEGQGASSCRLTRPSVRGVLPRETSNTGNPCAAAGPCLAAAVRGGPTPDSTAPTGRFRSSASDRAASRISSSMFSVVLMPENLTKTMR